MISDIFIRSLKPSGFWDGQFVMSSGNENHIYKILLSGSGPQYQCCYRISDFKKPTLHEIKWEPWQRVGSHSVTWIETTITRNLNLQLEREKKLNLLGI